MPTEDRGIFVEVGNLLQAGYKHLILQPAARYDPHRALAHNRVAAAAAGSDKLECLTPFGAHDRLSSCSEQLPIDSCTTVTLCYTIGSNPHSTGSREQAAVIASLGGTDIACMQ